MRSILISIVVFDGVYASGRSDTGGPEFFPLRAPEDSEIAALAQILSERISRLPELNGVKGNPNIEDSDPLAREEPGLAGLYAASVSNRIAGGPNAGRRAVAKSELADPEALDARTSRRCANVNGYSLHANVAIRENDRLQLERLIRYAARPPIAAERLEQLDDGRLLYRFKRPWRNGATHVIYSPLELLERLTTLVPAPRAHLTRYHGIIAPSAKWRCWIVPCVAASAGAAPAPHCDEPAALANADVQSQTLAGKTPSPASRRRNYPWAELLKRIFSADLSRCEQCGGMLRIISAIHPPIVTRKILEHLGLPSRPPPIAPARIPSQYAFDPA